MNEFDVEKFADDWITELICDLQTVTQAYENRSEDWKKALEFEIELRVWQARYRKVSQLCHSVGGNTVIKFERIFSHGINEYKYKYKF